MSDITVGDVVKAHYKSGVYVGEVIEDRNNAFLFEVRGVLKHPQQGDLHNPNKTEGVFFHQRRALSYREKANVSKASIQSYEGSIPEYEVSLKESLTKLKLKLEQKETDFNKKARKQLESLEQDYFKN